MLRDLASSPAVERKVISELKKRAGSPLSEGKLKQISKALDGFAHSKDAGVLVGALQELLPAEAKLTSEGSTPAAISSDDLHLVCFEFVLS